MPLLCRNSGIKVPIIPATTVTVIKEMEMAREVRKLPFQSQVKNNSMDAKTVPLSRANNISLISRPVILPLRSSLAAHQGLKAAHDGRSPYASQ